MALFSLKNQTEFDFVQYNGSKQSGVYFIIIMSFNLSLFCKKYNLTEEYIKTFFGIKVSRKFSKKAVIRNKIQRRIKNIIQNISKNKEIDLNNTSFFIIPKKNSLNCNFSDLQIDMQRIIKKLIKIKSTEN